MTMLRLECVVVNVLDVVSTEEDARDFQETESPPQGESRPDRHLTGEQKCAQVLALHEHPSRIQVFLCPGEPERGPARRAGRALFLQRLG
jgi:hypothetical protein